jgi:hypothetical protein
MRSSSCAVPRPGDCAVRRLRGPVPPRPVRAVRSVCGPAPPRPGECAVWRLRGPVPPRPVRVRSSSCAVQRLRGPVRVRCRACRVGRLSRLVRARLGLGVGIGCEWIQWRARRPAFSRVSAATPWSISAVGHSTDYRWAAGLMTIGWRCLSDIPEIRKAAWPCATGNVLPVGTPGLKRRWGGVRPKIEVSDHWTGGGAIPLAGEPASNLVRSAWNVPLPPRRCSRDAADGPLAIQKPSDARRICPEGPVRAGVRAVVKT